MYALDNVDLHSPCSEPQALITTLELHASSAPMIDVIFQHLGITHDRQILACSHGGKIGNVGIAVFAIAHVAWKACAACTPALIDIWNQHMASLLAAIQKSAI